PSAALPSAATAIASLHAALPIPRHAGCTCARGAIHQSNGHPGEPGQDRYAWSPTGTDAHIRAHRRWRTGRNAQFQRGTDVPSGRSEEHTSELQSRENIVYRLLLE